MFEYRGAKALLIRQQTRVLEIIRNSEGKIDVFRLKPKLVNREVRQLPTETVGANVEKGGKIGVETYSIKPLVPTASGVKYTLSYTTNPGYIQWVRLDAWWDLFGQRATLHTEGKFYIDYGDEVVSATNLSYHDEDLGYELRSYSESTSSVPAWSATAYAS
ncbi:hypothetical protein AKJ57_04175 [candidate division MSBL1 archaeon SCGC-AAA259A05]|uniref:Uncharacterized protein n=1 Tax=candidate division MSBL1 archaeon SCGC-AAA259A05 TaxID=1698259 RepID=A0A133U875_9EURY|nr:hypothetical protein AKJ57_04175 [candidate division MSBL1 archaeon SCGC-AAA259A05]